MGGTAYCTIAIFSSFLNFFVSNEAESIHIYGNPIITISDFQYCAVFFFFCRGLKIPANK